MGFDSLILAFFDILLYFGTKISPFTASFTLLSVRIYDLNHWILDLQTRQREDYLDMIEALTQRKELLTGVSL